MDNNPADAMPFARSLGVKVIEVGPDKIVGELEIRPDLCTAGKILHGGAAMAFADSLGAIGAFMTLPEGAKGTTTIESKTNFVGAAKEGTIVVGETTPIHTGRRISVWQTRVTRADGKLVAIITQSQMAL